MLNTKEIKNLIQTNIVKDHDTLIDEIKQDDAILQVKKIINDVRKYNRFEILEEEHKVYSRMYNKWEKPIIKKVLLKWMETFVDKDTMECIDIERSQELGIINPENNLFYSSYNIQKDRENKKFVVKYEENENTSDYYDRTITQLLRYQKLI